MSTTTVAARSKTRWKRVLVTVGLVIAAVWAVGFAGFYYAMCQKPETFGNVMKHTGPAPFLLFPFETMWKSARAGHLSVGDAAPDFTLPRLDHAGIVTLSAERGIRPVILIFGSYT